MNFLAALLFLQIGFDPSAGSAGPKVTIDGAIQNRAGDVVQGVVTATIADGWHINSNQPTESYAIPTVLTLDGAQLTSATYPKHEMRSFEFTQGKPIAVYTGTVQIPFTAKVTGSSIHATLRYQACSDRICLPPNRAEAEIGLGPQASGLGSTAAPVAASLPRPEARGPRPDAPDRLAATFASSGLPLTLLILFVGGLALNLTPCVFPLIPITIGFFAMQSDGRRGRRLALSSMYVLGIVITYTILGVVAAIGGKMFGAWLQLPIVLIAFAGLMLVLAASMFGAYEIQPPRWIANRSGGRAGMAGALTMGLAIGIVAAPCVGPVVISLLTLVAQIGKPAVGALMFGSLAFGLGFPYLVALNALPRPGEWMVQVKKAMGFVLVAMAFYFLRPLTGDLIFKWGVVISLLIGSAFLFISRGTAGRAMRLACASLLLVAGVAFAIPTGGAEVIWTKYDAAALATARAAGKPVIIDFTADWCIPCKELDARTFRNGNVAAEMQRFARIKADVTQSNDTTAALMKQYGVIGPPTVIFVDASGRELRDLRLVGFEKPEEFLKRLQRAR
ncbi:MAG TPA: cytochrome c biogenesis protein CcdA [Thermoanaerobaculia bacterium]|nr:cytochrome c biogenesis protein CcdA [Thermoanaerobaculia bacterium]